MNIFARFFADLLVTIFTVICWELCLDKKVEIKSKKFIIHILTQTAIVFLIAIFIPNPLRTLITFIILAILNYFFVSKNIRHSLLLVIISQLIVLVVEFVFVFGYSCVQKDGIEKLNDEPLLILIINILIISTTMILLKVRVPQTIFKFTNKITELIKNSETFCYIFMIITIIIISLTESYMKLPIQIILITNIIMGIVFITITLKMTIIKSKLNKIDNKYQTSLTSLKEHELLIDKLRINNHENKNELLTIRNMIKDKKTIKYIDKLLDNKTKDNNKIMKETYKIPEGGLRATIYSKMCLMDKYKINYQLDIAKDIRTTDLINLDDELILNICKILGVFLDNSIEAVKDLKEKQITIEIYKMDDRLYIEITNNFEGKIDINKMSNKRYTTKGEGHGYGLSLVSKIINENKDILENEKEINGNNFTQTLKIKM